MAAPLVELSNGEKIPALGLGTWQGVDNPNVVGQAVKHAIDAGYRHFDCAFVYRNEKEIGNALKEKIAEGVVKREDLYIVTKLWNDKHKLEQVVPACKESLKNFGFDYIDLYLIHWPMSVAKETGGFFSLDENNKPHPSIVDYLETWKGMEECVKLGLTKSIGLSNFNSVQIDRVLSIAKIKPMMNQVECNPNLNQKKLIEFCSKRGIAITAYSPFGAPLRYWAKPTDTEVVIERPETLALAKKYGKTAAQVLLRYLVDIGTIPIPKSSSKERIQQNIDIFDFKLTPEEIAIIDTFNTGTRTCASFGYDTHKDYPFHLEF
ncbi:aldose reductase [Cephus cinctus]|uniref:Aldose reductase n=1 Tax=Cephus cinctus TaxID=211228 RepID=A0AAJ7C6Z4_CEPCN|nr:aldose reductase [Cephus cinctus]